MSRLQKRQVKLFLFSNMCVIVMLVTAVCLLRGIIYSKKKKQHVDTIGTKYNYLKGKTLTLTSKFFLVLRSFTYTIKNNCDCFNIIIIMRVIMIMIRIMIMIITMIIIITLFTRTFTIL